SAITDLEHPRSDAHSDRQSEPRPEWRWSALSFQAPLLLALLALVPLAAVAYVLAQRRRRRFAVRYTNVDVLAAVSAGRSYGRHLPALLGLLALSALLVALARPQHTVAAVRHEATVMLLFDTSGSMTSTDVKP